MKIAFFLVNLKTLDLMKLGNIRKISKLDRIIDLRNRNFTFQFVSNILSMIVSRNNSMLLTRPPDPCKIL